MPELSLYKADEQIAEARMRFEKEKRLYEEALHKYYKNLRKLDMVMHESDTFDKNIERLLKENNIPLSKVKKFNDKRVFEYLISRIGCYDDVASGKIEDFKKLNPDTVQKLSAAIVAGKNDYIFNQIMKNYQKPDYISPIIKPIIKDSYGVIVYEDQVDKIINLILDTNEYEIDMFYETLQKLHNIGNLYKNKLRSIENLSKIDGSINIIDYIKQNYCDIYIEQFKTPCYGFISSAIEKGIREKEAKKLFSLLLAYFTNGVSNYKNTRIHYTKQLYAKAYIDLYCPNRLLDSVKEK